MGFSLPFSEILGGLGSERWYVCGWSRVVGRRCGCFGGFLVCHISEILGGLGSERWYECGWSRVVGRC